MTGFVTPAGDLSTLLAPRGSLAAISNTGFVDSSGTDLANVYAGASFGTAYSTVANTGFKVGATDIASLFAKVGSLFTPHTDTFTTAGSFSITVPVGASTLVVEAWGGTGPGGSGSGSGCSAMGGGGGSSGSYCRTSIAVTPGSTINYTVGAASIASTVSAGTQAITTMTATAGTAGGNGPTSAGGVQPSIATGGNVTNVRGTAGTVGGSGGGAAGGAAVIGVNATGTIGGNGSIAGSGHPGFAGSAGVIAFRWT
jgi:hypothetical protein